MEATNRQRKILTFFGVTFSPNLSFGAANWEVARILESPENRDSWRRYVYLTQDFDNASPELVDYSESELLSVEIPLDWSSSEAAKEYRGEVVAGELSTEAPFDNPEPEVVFTGKVFVFTGRFSFGTRKKCQDEVIRMGGHAPPLKNVNNEVDYLVIGNKGSPTWKRDSYGIKIEEAVFMRRGHGRPAIISEEHWATFLEK